MGYLIGIIIVLAIALSIIGGVFNGALEGGAFMLSKVIAGGELRFGIFFVVCALACTLLAHLFESPFFLFCAKVFVFLIVLLIVIYLGRLIFKIDDSAKK